MVSMRKGHPMANDPAPGKPVVTYKIRKSGVHIDVEITSGKLTGRTARVIPMPPSGAYFNNEPPTESPTKKRA
jgi:hypothetical protein